MKTAFDGFNSRLKSNYELQDISIKFLNITKQREKRQNKQPQNNIQGLWDNGVTQCNICITEYQNKKEKMREKIFEIIMIQNFLQLSSDTKQIQKVQRVAENTQKIYNQKYYVQTIEKINKKYEKEA